MDTNRIDLLLNASKEKISTIPGLTQSKLNNLTGEDSIVNPFETTPIGLATPETQIPTNKTVIHGIDRTPIPGLLPIDRTPMDLSENAIKEGAKRYDLQQSNLLDTAQYGIGKALANAGDFVVDAGTGLGKEIYKASNTLKGKYETPEQVNKQFTKSIKGTWLENHFDKSGDFKSLDKYKQAVEYGYDDVNTREAMKSLGEAWQSKDPKRMGESLISATVNAGPEFLLESAGEFGLGLLGKAGIALNAGSYTNQILEDRKKVTGREATPQEAALVAVAGTAEAYLNKLGVDEMVGKTNLVRGAIKTIAEYGGETSAKNALKTIAKKAAMGGAAVAGKAGYEGLEEVLQEGLEIIGEKYGTAAQNDILSDKSYQRLFQAFGGGFAGGATAGSISEGVTLAGNAIRNPDIISNISSGIKAVATNTDMPTPQEEKTGVKGSIDETAVTPHFTEEHANVLDRASQQNDFGTYKATMKDIITNAQKSPETYGQVMKQLDPYIKEFGRMQANLAKQYEETGSVDNVKLGAEPSDTLLGTLHYIRDDKKAEEFADKVRQMKEFRDQYNGNDGEIDRIINDTLEQRKELKTLLEARHSVAHEGFNDEREGYLSYYQEAKNGNVTAKNRLGYFADIHVRKADTLKAQREEVLNNKADELHNFTREANAAGINVSEQEMLTALLAKNGKLEGRITKGETPISIEKFNQLKDHFGNRLDTTDIKSGSQKNTIDLKYWESKSGRNDGVFELNPSDAWSELALTRYGNVFSSITKPSGLNDTINSVDREVKTMKNLLNRLDRSDVQESVEEPTDTLEKDRVEAEEIASKEQEPTSIETVKETARPEPTKKEKRKAKKEAARKEYYDKEKEQIELEQQQAKEQEPTTIETVEEGKKAPMPEKSSVFAEARKVMDTKYFDGLLEQVQRQDGEDNISYVQRLIKLVRNMAELRSKQSGTNASYKLGMLNEIISKAKEHVREVRSQEEKEINELKEDLKQAKELGKTARIEMAALSRLYEAQGKTLQLFKLVSKDEATQKLIDERNRIVKELKNKEKGLKTSITIMRNFLDSRMEDRDRSAKNFKQAMLEKLDSMYKHAGYIHPSKVMSLSKMMQSFLKMIWLDKTQVGKKIDHFLKKLEKSLVDISKLREDLSKTNKELSKYVGSRIGEAQAKEREVMKQLGETDAKYTRVLIDGMALGAQKKDSTFKYGIKGVSNDIMEYQDGETSKQYEARVRKALGSNIPANIVSKIKQNVLHIDGLIRQHEMMVTNELLDTKKVNSDFARYDVAFNSNPEFVKEVNKFAKVIESIIPEIKDVAEAGRLSEDYARGLVMQADGTIDRNMAGAMLASVLDELKNNSKYMTMTTKDIAAMYGLDEVEVGGDMKQRLDQIGVPAKYMAAHMGDMITDLMGIKMKEGADSSVYRDFKASLGNMAMYAAQQAGYVNVNAVKNAELADIFEVPANESEAVGYYIKQKPGIIDKIKEKHSLLNDTLIIPSNKKGVRFNKRNFDKDECAQ